MRDASEPHCESHVRIAYATDGRTDRTKNRITVASNLKAVDAGARTGGMASLSELIQPDVTL